MAEQRCPGCMRTKLQHPVCEHCGYDARTPNLPHQLPAGTVLQNRYLVGKVLGQGGFGITYMGWDQYLDAPVAIKEYYPNGIVIRDSSLSLSVTAIEGEYSKFYVENRQRFFREAKALARFAEVPNIVHIQNLFLDNNTAYIVMEYLHGVTLKHYVSKKGGKLSPKETFAILLPIMKALETVHEAGIVHRDLSPDNIMLLPGGKAKLLDFGAVREVHNPDVDKPLTKSTESILKHGFAPIEQYQSRGGLGPWTDVYALCATIYYCLTGTVPGDAPLRVMGEAEVDWSSVPGLTAQQQRALAAGMAIAPKQRTRSVKELRRELFQADAPTLPKGSQSAYPSGTVPLAKGNAYTAPLSDPGHTISNEPYTAPVRTSAKTTTATTPAPQTAQAQKKQALPKWPIPAAAIALIVLVMALLIPKKEPEIHVDIPPTEGTHQEVPRDPQDYTLMYFGGDLGFKPYAVVARLPAFNTTASRCQVETITFLSSTESAPDDAVDVSAGNKGTVLAWVENNGHKMEKTIIIDDRQLYDLYIASDSIIYAPANCESMFQNFINLKSIHFNNAFCTSRATTMSHMFDNCESLASFDVSGFDTVNVTDMRYMFSDCDTLTGLDVSSFDTRNVTDMSYMFSGCDSLVTLDLSGFDTSNVKTMYSMFENCPKLTNVNANFDVSSVTGYDNFMDKGDTFNSRPWEELFQ